MKKNYVENIRGLANLQSDCEYILKQGNYTVGIADTKTEFLYLSNNDGGDKRIAFFLDGLKNVVLDFSGSVLTFEGRITPFIPERLSPQ